MVLDNYVVDVSTKTVLPDVTLQVVVGHAQLEFQAIVHVAHARVGTAFGVDLSVEEFGRLDTGHHVSGAAINADVVTGA